MLNTKITEGSQRFSDQLDVLARTRLFIQRKTKSFSAQGFLLTLIHAALGGQASFNQLALKLNHFEPKALTKQALWKRINTRATAFMLDALALTISHRWQENTSVHTRLKSLFKRVLIEDSTQQKLPKTNAAHFPGHGNASGQTAGVKVDLTIDLITGSIVSSELHGATQQDREIGKNLVDLVGRNDLVLRDRGYFSLSEFALIEEKSAFWLSRIPANLTIKLTDGKSLDTHLKNSQGQALDLPVWLGAQQHKARLVAIRADERTAAETLRKAKEAALRNGKTLSHSARLRCQWHILVTNISEEMMNAIELGKLYQCRWNIEIVFRAWKQSMDLTKALSRTSNEHHIQAIVLAAMIYKTLAIKAVVIIRSRLPEGKWPSYEKIFDDFRSHVNRLTDLSTIWTYEPDLRHVTTESRKSRKPLKSLWSMPLRAHPAS